METLEVGQGLVALCKEGKFKDAVEKFYAENIGSIEGAAMPGMERRMEGLDAIRGKNSWWEENHEVHSMEVDGPFVAEDSDQFLVYFQIDVTGKYDNKRIQSSEVGIYTVKDGKVAEERFFFTPR